MIYIIDKQLKSGLTYILFISTLMPSPTKKLSPDKNALLAEQNLKLSPVKQFQQKLFTKDYFCHYSNAIYMGGMDCFKKLGHGIMLMDNGTCAITCHSHDNIINHNVFFADGCMTSLIVGLTRARSICFRTGPFMLYVRMSANNEVEGIGFFIHYRHRKLFRLKFQNEQISIKQRITDPSILKKVFDQNNLSQLIQQSHCNALKMQFQQQLPPYIRCAKSGNKYIIGIAEPQYKDINFLGLCFKIVVKDLVSEFDVFLEERGYVDQGKMEKFGERHFQNGNYYIGEFKADRFQGRGVLVYPKENKWTLGNFQSGQIQKVIQSSVTNQNVTYPAAIKKIHQYSKPYIQSSVKIIPSSKWLYALVKEVDEKDPYEHESIDYTKQQNQISQNLNIVNEDYVNRRYENRTEQAIKRLTQQQKIKEKQSKSKGKKPSPTKIQNSYKNSPKKKSGTNDKNRRYLTRQADGTFRANSPPNKKPIPDVIDKGQIKDKDKERSRSRSRSNERQKSKDRNEGAFKPPLHEDGIKRTKTENYGQKKELDRARPNISTQDEQHIARAITGQYGRQFSPTRQPNNYNLPKQSPINRVGALMDNRPDPYNPMNKPANLYPDHRLNLSPYKLYSPSPYLSPFSSPYPNYPNISPQRDYFPSPVVPLVRSRTNSYELYQKTRVSPEHGRRRHFKYIDDDDDEYEYNRLSNRPYARNGAKNYEF